MSGGRGPRFPRGTAARETRDFSIGSLATDWRGLSKSVGRTANSAETAPTALEFRTRIPSASGAHMMSPAGSWTKSSAVMIDHAAR